MTKYDFPYGTLSSSDDFAIVAYEVIRSAYTKGWNNVDFDKIESELDELTDELAQKRDEAIIWLNQNCVTENVEFEYFETVDDSEEDDVPLAVFGLYSRKE